MNPYDSGVKDAYHGGNLLQMLWDALGRPAAHTPPAGPGIPNDTGMPGLGMAEGLQPQPGIVPPRTPIPGLPGPAPASAAVPAPAVPSLSANAAGAPYSAPGTNAAAPSSPDNSTELLGHVPGGTAGQVQGAAPTGDPMMDAMSAMGSVKAPAAPDVLKPSTPGAPQAKPLESNLLDILTMNQKLREARTVLPMFSQMLSGVR